MQVKRLSTRYPGTQRVSKSNQDPVRIEYFRHRRWAHTRLEVGTRREASTGLGALGVQPEHRDRDRTGQGSVSHHAGS